MLQSINLMGCEISWIDYGPTVRRYKILPGLPTILTPIAANLMQPLLFQPAAEIFAFDAWPFPRLGIGRSVVPGRGESQKPKEAFRIESIVTALVSVEV